MPLYAGVPVFHDTNAVFVSPLMSVTLTDAGNPMAVLNVAYKTWISDNAPTEVTFGSSTTILTLAVLLSGFVEPEGTVNVPVNV